MKSEWRVERDVPVNRPVHYRVYRLKDASKPAALPNKEYGDEGFPFLDARHAEQLADDLNRVETENYIATILGSAPF